MPRKQSRQFVLCLHSHRPLGWASAIDLGRVDVFDADFLAPTALVAQDETVPIPDDKCDWAARRLLAEKGGNRDVAVLGSRTGAWRQAGKHDDDDARANVTPPSSRRD